MLHKLCKEFLQEVLQSNIFQCVDIKWKRQQSYFSEQETGMWENINCNNNKEWAKPN